MRGGKMTEITVQVIPLKLFGGRVVIQAREVVRFLRSRETYLRVAREVTAKRRRPAARRAYDKKIREWVYLLHAAKLTKSESSERQLPPSEAFLRMVLLLSAACFPQSTPRYGRVIASRE